MRRGGVGENEYMKIDVKKQEYVILLDLLAKANDSVKMLSVIEKDELERLLDAHKLANKFISHALTILNISHGTIIQELPSFPKINFPDSASIDVLTRAAMEAFLRFHLVFYAPKTKDEKAYRYLVHKVAGIVENMSYGFKNGKHEEGEKEELDRLRQKLESNKIYLSLKENQRTGLFQGKESDLWRWNPDTKKRLSWYDIGRNAGFGKLLAHDMYKHLSGYAHSGSLSIIQTDGALTNKKVNWLIQTSINIMEVLTANMIEEYCQMFPEAQKVLEDSGAINFVHVYVNVGHRLGENLATE